MLAYILRRIGLAGVMLFGLVCLTFVISNIAPSDPAALAAGPDAGRSQIEQARREYGLDKPLPEQFLRYVTDLLVTEENRRTLAPLTAGVDPLFIESPFLEADLDHALRKNHLTARQAGQIAREAGARSVVPFHFSPRYGARAAELVAELQAAWRPVGTLKPAA